MPKFNPAISLVKDTNTGEFTTVNYTFFEPGKRFAQDAISQVQITQFDDGDLPGIKIEVDLVEQGNGNPFTFSGTIAINSGLVLDSSKPFLDLGIYTVHPVTGQKTRRGGGIVRSIDGDM